MADQDSCTCDVVSETIHLCSEHHRYWIGGTERTSVSRVMRDVLPPTYPPGIEDRVENARERGTAVDALVSAYVTGQPLVIPAGIPVSMEDEIKSLFEKFADWWDKQGFKDVSSQRIVHDGEIAGAVDLHIDGAIFDVKCTYDLLPSHRLQVAAYLDLDKKAEGGMLIHLTKRFKAPKFEAITMTDEAEWTIVRDFWSLKKRLSA